MISTGAYTKKTPDHQRRSTDEEMGVFSSDLSLGQRRTAPNMTVPFASVLISPKPKDAVRAIQSDQVTHDVFLPSET